MPTRGGKFSCVPVVALFVIEVPCTVHWMQRPAGSEGEQDHWSVGAT